GRLLAMVLFACDGVHCIACASLCVVLRVACSVHVFCSSGVAILFDWGELGALRHVARRRAWSTLHDQCCSIRAFLDAWNVESCAPLCESFEIAHTCAYGRVVGGEAI